MTNAHGVALSIGARVEVELPPGRPNILRQPVGCSIPHLGSFGLSVITFHPPADDKSWAVLS